MIFEWFLNAFLKWFFRAADGGVMYQSLQRSVLTQKRNGFGKVSKNHLKDPADDRIVPQN